jgi:translation initiation factor IF-1
MEKKKWKLGAWMDELQKAAEGKKTVQLETKDGVRRTGRLTGLRKDSTIRINGRDQPIITAFELNNDTSDTIPFFNLKVLDIYDD